MVDQRELRQRVLLELVASKLTLLPILGGLTVLLGQWAVDSSNGLVTFAALGCILISLGIFFTRIFVGSEKITQAILAQLQQETKAAREQALDQLDEKLRQDGDPRTEKFLRDLRELIASFHAGYAWTKDSAVPITLGIMSGVEELFEGCVKSLERSWDLWQTADRMSTPEARQPLLEQRKRILADVQHSIKKLGQILAEMARLSVDQDTSEDLQRISAELDQELEIARSVDARMHQEFGSVDQERE